jgi:hypothetical protein
MVAVHHHHYSFFFFVQIYGLIFHVLFQKLFVPPHVHGFVRLEPFKIFHVLFQTLFVPSSLLHARFSLT